MSPDNIPVTFWTSFCFDGKKADIQKNRFLQRAAMIARNKIPSSKGPQVDLAPSRIRLPSRSPIRIRKFLTAPISDSYKNLQLDLLCDLYCLNGDWFKRSRNLGLNYFSDSICVVHQKNRKIIGDPVIRFFCLLGRYLGQLERIWKTINMRSDFRQRFNIL